MKNPHLLSEGYIIFFCVRIISNTPYSVNISFIYKQIFRIFIIMKFVLTEQERNRIKGLYEQSETIPNGDMVKLDDKTVKQLPNNIRKEIVSSMLKDKELIDKLKTEFNTNVTTDPLNFLISNGVTPYIFVIPANIERDRIISSGLSVKIGNTPFTVNLNLGTDPKNVLDSMRFSRVNLSLPINKSKK